MRVNTVFVTRELVGERDHVKFLDPGNHSDDEENTAGDLQKEGKDVGQDVIHGKDLGRKGRRVYGRSTCIRRTF